MCMRRLVWLTSFLCHYSLHLFPCLLYPLFTVIWQLQEAHTRFIIRQLCDRPTAQWHVDGTASTLIFVSPCPRRHRSAIVRLHPSMTRTFATTFQSPAFIHGTPKLDWIIYIVIRTSHISLFSLPVRQSRTNYRSWHRLNTCTTHHRRQNKRLRIRHATPVLWIPSTNFLGQ